MRYGIWKWILVALVGIIGMTIGGCSSEQVVHCDSREVDLFNGGDSAVTIRRCRTASAQEVEMSSLKLGPNE